MFKNQMLSLYDTVRQLEDLMFICCGVCLYDTVCLQSLLAVVFLLYISQIHFQFRF